MKFYSHRKTRLARYLALLALCSFLIVAHPRQTMALGVVVSDPETEAETTATTIETTDIDATDNADLALQTTSWTLQLAYSLQDQSNWLDQKIDYLKNVIRKRMKWEADKALAMGPANAQIDNVRVTAEAQGTANRVAAATRADTTTACATTALHQVKSAVEGNNAGIRRAKVGYFNAEGNMQTSLSYQTTKTLVPLYHFCRLVSTNNGWSLSELPYAQAQAIATASCAQIFSNAS